MSSQSSSKRSKWQNATRRDVTWTKEDLYDVIYWCRQMLGVIIGVIYGIIPIEGFVGHLSFAIINVLLLHMYYNKYLGIDEQDFSRWELFSEGFPTSYAFFLVSWVVSYNFVHFS